MWFHLLSVATFLALGSCQDFYGFSRKLDTSSCQGMGCPCNCPQNSCAPCPIPKPFECLSGCGTSECPCLNSSGNLRSDNAQMSMGETKDVDLAVALSTVNVRPTGPVCTAVNLKNNMMLTLSTCVAGIALEDLYVTVNKKKIESLKVIEILTDPYATQTPSPVLLVTKQPTGNLTTLVLPALPMDASRRAEVQKWQVSMNGMVYVPVKTKVKSYEKCMTSEDLICAETYNTTVMGWNDIGSVLVEQRDNINWLQGLYIGNDLYNATHTIKYMPVYKYEGWLYGVVEKYS